MDTRNKTLEPLHFKLAPRHKSKDHKSTQVILWPGWVKSASCFYQNTKANTLLAHEIFLGIFGQNCGNTGEGRLRQCGAPKKCLFRQNVVPKVSLRMFEKAYLSVCAMLISCGLTYGQFKVIGPEKEAPGNLVVITLQDFKGNDIVVDCLPKNSYWTANKNLKGEPQISFATNKQGVYTFVFATNDGKQTFMQVWPVTIGGVIPDPNVPVPNPNPNPNPVPLTDLAKRFESVYMVQPNATQLANYIAVFQALDKQNDASAFSTYKQAWDVLVSSTKDKLKSDTDLRPLRDEVAKYLVENTGRNSSAYDKTILSTALKNIVAGLQSVQKAHP